MPAIAVSQTQFDRFTKFAEPFVDTHESAFEKILNLAEAGLGIAAFPPSTDRRYGLTNLPDMKHTTITRIRIGDTSYDTQYWSFALIEVLKVAKTFGSLVEATKTLPVNLTADKKTVEGYKWHSELGVSVQGLAATGVAKTVLSLCEKYGITIEIGFFWQDKPEAANPGQRGVLTANLT